MPSKASAQHLAELLQTAQAILAETNTQFAHLSSDQLNWKPAPDSWSIAQCYQHLILLNLRYYASIERSMATARTHNDNGERPFTPGVFGEWFRKLLEPKASLKIPTFGIFTPEASAFPASILDDFAENQRLLMQYIERAQNMDITRTKIATPVSRLLRLRLGDAFGVLLTHEQRHIAQAQRVMQQKEFPTHTHK